MAPLTDRTVPRVALVGYGRMGRPMGRRLAAGGYQLTVSDLDPAARRAAEHDGAEVVDSPRDAAAAAEVVLTMLPDPEATLDAAHGAQGILAGLRAGALWIEMSSSHPAVTRGLAEAAQGRGASLLDAPVSGGVDGARDGTLTIMAGGAAELFEQARPLLEVVGQQLFHVGERPGDGDLAKTVNNLLSAANLTAAAEALILGRRAGLDPARLVEALATGSGSSHALTAKLPKYVLSGTFDAGFTIGQMLKDLRIGSDVAAELDSPSQVGSLIHAIWSSLAEEGHAEEDHTAVVALIASRANTKIAPGEG